MEYIKLRFDKNAYIDNLDAAIMSHGGKTKARLSFVNLCSEGIVAIKFHAVGYNSFGDIVRVYGEDFFWLILQNIHIDAGKKVNDMDVSLPSMEIKRLDLKVSQICMDNGRVLDCREPDYIEINMRRLEGEKKEIVNRLVDARMQYYPKKIEGDYWVCACGRFNHGLKCSCCNVDKERIFEKISDIKIEEMKENEQRVREQEEKRRNAKRNETKKTMTIITITIAAMIVICSTLPNAVSYFTELFQRASYTSETQMKNEIIGNYTHINDETGKTDAKITISNMKIVEKFFENYREDVYVADRESSISKLYPKEGRLKSDSGDEYVFRKNGTVIKNDDEIYVKRKQKSNKK